MTDFAVFAYQTLTQRAGGWTGRLRQAADRAQTQGKDEKYIHQLHHAERLPLRE